MGHKYKAFNVAVEAISAGEFIADGQIPEWAIDARIHGYLQKRELRAVRGHSAGVVVDVLTPVGVLAAHPDDMIVFLEHQSFMVMAVKQFRAIFSRAST